MGSFISSSSSSSKRFFRSTVLGKLKISQNFGFLRSIFWFLSEKSRVRPKCDELFNKIIKRLVFRSNVRVRPKLVKILVF